MGRLKLFAILVVSVGAAVGLAGVANAAPAKSGAPHVDTSRAAALARAESAVKYLTAHPASVTSTNFIQNSAALGFTGGLGVIHVYRGAGSNYAHGLYDAVLPASYYSDVYFGWTTTSGWYTGPGYCTVQYRADRISEHQWVRQSPDLGSGQHFIGGGTYYIVEPYAC
jgi:hypothetical protein